MKPARAPFSRRLSCGLTVAVLAGLGFATVPAASGAIAEEITCTGDQCDEGRWMLARGVDNGISYWGMGAGHNCTNYVAWRLIGDGIERPTTNPGDATSWAERAIADGYLVDLVPRVGAVAHWEGLSGGHGIYGHVAYVEQVNADGTILISEDFYGEDQLGPLTYRTIPASSVSNFIHYGDHPDWLRQVSGVGGVWSASSTGLDPAPTALSAMTLDGKTPMVFYSEAGVLVQATPRLTGWQAVNTGVRFDATSMGAVDMGRGMPYLMSVDNGMLVMTVETDTGWQRMPTGIEITGEVAAVNLGGLWPTVFLSQGGSLSIIWGDNAGWHIEQTGTQIGGPISAALSPTGWPEIYSVENGMLFQTWQDETGWHKQLTGVTASGRTSAVLTPMGVQVMLLQDDAVFRITRAGNEFTKEPTAMDGGELTSAVNLGGETPTLVQVG